MVEVMKIMATSINMSHACTATVSAPSLLSMPLLTHASLDTTGHYGQVWVSLLLGHCSFLLGPSVHKVLFVPSKSLFPSPV